MKEETGKLYVVATPIGNLADISQRARDTLADVTLVAAEDTRRTGAMLRKLWIDTKCVSLHEHNEQKRAPEIIERIKQGDSVALVSDAGTPLISDPGYRVVCAVRDAGLDVVPIPGACAAIAALSAAGLPSDRFVFEGFPPSKKKARRTLLNTLRHETRTIIFYEAPHRIVELVDDCIRIFGPERRAVVARELTKMFEEFRAGPLESLAGQLAIEANATRGEFVLLVAGDDDAGKSEDDEELDRVLSALMTELPLSKAVRIAAEITGRRKNQVYSRAMDLSQSQPDAPGPGDDER